MTRYRTGYLADGALAAFLGLSTMSALILGGGPAGAAESSTPAPKAFCADMTKTAKAGQSLLAHPSPVAANRATLAALAASHFLGQNAPAIAATEAQYMEMWAQDVTAMEGYHKGAVAEEAKPELQRQATVVLGKVDVDVAKSCPSDDKAFSALTTVEKKDSPDR